MKTVKEVKYTTNRIGYARVSTTDQNLSRQLRALEDCSKVFSEKLSGKNTERPALHAMLGYIREGDIVVISELERLGRNNKELTDAMNKIQDKGVTLEILDLPSLNGIENENLRRLLFNLIIEIYKYQAEDERNKIKERQAQGIEIAKEQGKYRGKPQKSKENDPHLQHAFKLFLEGNSDKDVERLTGINRRTFQRYRKRYGVNRK